MSTPNKILLGIGTFVGIMLLLGWVAINEPARMEVFTTQWSGRSIERGADLYHNYCVACHAEDGLGLAGVAPALNNPYLFRTENPARVANQRLESLLREQSDLQDAITTHETNVSRRAELQMQLTQTAEGTPERQQIQAELDTLDAQILLFDPGTQARIDSLTGEIAALQQVVDEHVAQGWDPNRDVRLREVQWPGSLEDYLRGTLVGGRPTSALYWPQPMPAWAQLVGRPLREDEIDNLVNYLLNYEQQSLALTPNDIRQSFKNPVDAALANVSGEPRVVVGDAVDVRELELTGGDVQAGATAYVNYACAGCHTTPGGAAHNFAPTQGTWTRVANIRLRDPANADWETPEQYIANSILHPNDYITPGGTANVMPQNYGEQLTLEDLQNIIAYLATFQ